VTKPAVLGSRPSQVALAILGVVLAFVTVQVVRVHQSTGEFRLTPSQAPPKLHETGRDYRRSSLTPSDSLPKGTREIGETPGGGEVFGSRRLTLPGTTGGPFVATVIWVRAVDGRVWSYGLVGGP
jgi:hypothetical protein